MTVAKEPERIEKDNEHRFQLTLERQSTTTITTKRRRDDEGSSDNSGEKSEKGSEDDNYHSLTHRRRSRNHNVHDKEKRHRSSGPEKRSHHHRHHSHHKYDTSTRRSDKTNGHTSSRDKDRNNNNSRKDIDRHQVSKSLQEFKSKAAAAAATLDNHNDIKSVTVTESSSSSPSSSKTSLSPVAITTTSAVNVNSTHPPSPPPPPLPLPPSSPPPPPPPPSSSSLGTIITANDTTIPPSLSLSSSSYILPDSLTNTAAPITDTYHQYSTLDQQYSSHDQNVWNYYIDPSNTAWGYDPHQHYQQYQVTSSDASSYYDQQAVMGDPSMYYGQHYYTETFNQHDPTSYYASFTPPPPPPPPPPLPITYHDPTQSYSTIEEMGYPYPTFEDPAILFEKIGQVGEGTYGKVYKARNCKTGQLWALKRIRMKTEKEGFPITAMREIKLLQKLKHERIVLLQEILVSKGSVYMVLEYMDHDLSGILGHPNFRFEPAHSKSLTKQILQGLAYLHHMGILHRDMKGSNLLVNNKGELKIADFGLARIFHKNQPGDYTNRVITLWYRPPELLLGATSYDTAVDIWGVGCIMLEFFVGKPIFNGTDEISQLDSIYRIMGTPTKDTWPAVEELPWYELVRPKQNHDNVFRDTFKSLLTPGALILSEALLSMDPKNRPTAAEALEFDYFKTEEPKDLLPANLLDTNDDWHDFESKQRRRKMALI